MKVQRDERYVAKNIKTMALSLSLSLEPFIKKILKHALIEDLQIFSAPMTTRENKSGDCAQFWDSHGEKTGEQHSNNPTHALQNHTTLPCML